MASSARQAFRARLSGFRAALDSPSVSHVGAVSPPDDPARLLRNGLAVVSFNAVEDFIKQRMGEVLRRMSSCSIAFVDLPASLQHAATVGAADALRFQSRIRIKSGDAHGARALIQRTGRALASVDNVRYQLSEISFGYADANLNHEDIRKMLKGIGVSGGWQSIGQVANRAGLNLPALADDYQQAFQRRNSAAHDPTTDTPLQNLQDFTRQALAIAIGFDALVSRAAFRFMQGDSQLASGAACVDGSQINVFAFDDLAPQRRRRWSAAVSHARGTGDLIAITRAGVPIDWQPGDLERGRP